MSVSSHPQFSTIQPASFDSDLLLIHFRFQKFCVSVDCSCMLSKAFCSAFAVSLAKPLDTCLRLGRVLRQVTCHTRAYGVRGKFLSTSLMLVVEWEMVAWMTPLKDTKWHRVSQKIWLSAAWFLWCVSDWVCLFILLVTNVSADVLGRNQDFCLAHHFQ